MTVLRLSQFVEFKLSWCRGYESNEVTIFPFSLVAGYPELILWHSKSHRIPAERRYLSRGEEDTKLTAVQQVFSSMQGWKVKRKLSWRQRSPRCNNLSTAGEGPASVEAGGRPLSVTHRMFMYTMNSCCVSKCRAVTLESFPAFRRDVTSDP